MVINSPLPSLIGFVAVGGTFRRQMQLFKEVTFQTKVNLHSTFSKKRKENRFKKRREKLKSSSAGNQDLVIGYSSSFYFLRIKFTFQCRLSTRSKMDEISIESRLIESEINSMSVWVGS